MKNIVRVYQGKISIGGVEIDRADAELSLRDWFESIEFVDEDGSRLPMELEEDDSDDPEGDRG